MKTKLLIILTLIILASCNINRKILYYKDGKIDKREYYTKDGELDKIWYIKDDKIDKKEYYKDGGRFPYKTEHYKDGKLIKTDEY